MSGDWRSSISAGPCRNSVLSITELAMRMFSMNTVRPNLYASP